MNLAAPPEVAECSALHEGTPLPPTRLLLLGATLESDNRGIGALAMGALAILAHRYPRSEIQFVDYALAPTNRSVDVNGATLQVGMVNLRFSKKLWLPNHILRLLWLAAWVRIAGAAARARARARNPWFRQLDEADLAVAVSGGDSFSDIYGLGRFFYMTLPQLLVILLRKPLVLLPQTIGPLRSPVARSLARFVLRHAAGSYSREVGGVAEAVRSLKRDATELKLLFGYDMGFILQPRQPARTGLPVHTDDAAAARPLVGLNVSGLLSLGGYDGKNMFALQCDYAELMERVVAFLIDTHQVNVLLVPHVFGTSPESDVHAIDRLFERLRHRYPTQLFRLTECHDESEIKYVIGRCDLFIGSRMHACIAALSQAVPAVGIAYSQKFAGVLGSVGMGHLVADPRSLGIDRILDIIGRALADRAAIRLQLSGVMPEVRQRVLDVLKSTGAAHRSDAVA